MSKKTVAITINCQKPFIKHLDDEHIGKNNILFSSISKTYLPLLNMFADLEAEGIPFKVNMVISPTLCDMLADPVIQQQYIEWLDKIILLGQEEVSKYTNDSEKQKLAKETLDKAIQNKQDFQEVLNQDILSKFAYYARKGNIEFLGTTATSIFLPHYSDIEEVVSAQIETGLQLHKKYFGLAPEGFYLPYLAYYPGLEFIIRSYGFNYTVLDTHGLLFAEPQPTNGIFTPARCYNSLAVFGADNEDIQKYKSNPLYKNTEKDIGYEADSEYLANFLGSELKERVSTGYAYFQADGKTLYDSKLAKEQIEKDAKDFISSKIERLSKAQELIPEQDVSLVCTIEGDTLGVNWQEGIAWLEEVLRQTFCNNEIEVEFLSDLIRENHFSLQKIKPYFSSEEGTGYGENMLEHSNGWMLRYIRKASERMIDLTSRFTDDTGLKARALNLAAKEILLAQSAAWQQMINTKNSPEYAEQRFKESVLAFSTVYDSLGSNSISTEWLTRMEKKHTLFPEMNYMVFSSKQ
ncbi:MAG: 1,4-alpha-glucan branching protein domain-containing protein [Treponemataceae bacterium]|nr:1,4-alpha-glucan branching protein domain-containing protein [Treponemataceae bacterium]